MLREYLSCLYVGLIHASRLIGILYVHVQAMLDISLGKHANNLFVCIKDYHRLLRKAINLYLSTSISVVVSNKLRVYLVLHALVRIFARFFCNKGLGQLIKQYK